MSDRPAAAMAAALDWAYSQAASSLPGLGGAEQLGERYLAASGGSVEAAVDSLVTWQVRYAGAAGFLSNVGGVIALPVSIPANLASVLLIQLRMIAAIAHLRGYSVASDQVKTMALVCLTGRASAGLLRDVSVTVGTQVTMAVIGRLSRPVLRRLNGAVAGRLVARVASAGLVNTAKFVPVLGGVVGGGFDAAVTRGVASVAKRVFTPVQQGSHGDDEAGTDGLGAGQWLADDRRAPKPDQALLPQGSDRPPGAEGHGGVG